MLTEWNTGRPPQCGYYLGAWKRGSPPVWTVSELWFNPDAVGSGWFATRGYLDTPGALRDRMSTIPVEAWMPMPEYRGSLAPLAKGVASHG
jgi:hypothetical protein